MRCPKCEGGVKQVDDGRYVCIQCGLRAYIPMQQRGDVYLVRSPRSRRWMWHIGPWLAMLLAVGALVAGSEPVIGVSAFIVVMEWIVSTIVVAVRASPLGKAIAWRRALIVFFIGGALRLAVAAYVAWAMVQAAG